MAHGRARARRLASPMTNAAIDATVADRQVDAAGQHRQRLAAGEDREGDRGADGEADPGRADDPRLDELEDHDEEHEQRRSAG